KAPLDGSRSTSTRESTAGPLRCGISTQPMTAVGHLRPRQLELDRAACPLCLETGQVHHRETSAEWTRNPGILSLRSGPSCIKGPHKYRPRHANHNPPKAEVVSSNLAGRAEFQ